jgi:hypothetical protein
MGMYQQSNSNTTKKEELLERIQDYLLMGGLFNPELVIHDNVRDLIIEIREELNGKNQSK